MDEMMAFPNSNPLVIAVIAEISALCITRVPMINKVHEINIPSTHVITNDICWLFFMTITSFRIFKIVQ